ncbi:MAG: hypothetical protein N5P05_003529 [Chroococcopsis gigantea SAG 12.99]|jgi:hypothetical protein|nr:hypothetical protein [Chlorogloea purpurea SAG 13.99]MDV3001923.1 hypothetical protein [Chroococcopsis gigantea SAG 12.99]
MVNLETVARSESGYNTIAPLPAPDKKTRQLPVNLSPSAQDRADYEGKLLRYFIEYVRNTGDFNHPVIDDIISAVYLKSEATTETISPTINDSQKSSMATADNTSKPTVMPSVTEAPVCPTNIEDRTMVEGNEPPEQNQTEKSGTRRIKTIRIRRPENLPSEHEIIRGILQDTSANLPKATLRIKELTKVLVKRLIEQKNGGINLRQQLEQIADIDWNNTTELQIEQSLLHYHQEFATYIDRLLHITLKYHKLIDLNYTFAKPQELSQEIHYYRQYIEQNAQISKIKHDISLVTDDTIYLRRLNSYCDLLITKSNALINALQTINLENSK